MMTLGEFREKIKDLSDDVVIFVEYDCTAFLMSDIFVGVLLDGNKEYNTDRTEPYPIFRLLHKQPKDTKITAICIDCCFEEQSKL